MTGDGYACGYRAGARLRDMEFVQFTPAGLMQPDSLRGWSINHELLAQPGVRILDRCLGEIAAPGLPVTEELPFRLALIRQMQGAIQGGRGTRDGGLHLDLRDVAADAVGRFAPGLVPALAAAGLDPARDLLEVAPEVHFFMGGLEVDENGHTSIPGLFAVGEVAGGCHGANRLTHNAFPEAIVFAPRAGTAAARHTRKHPPSAIHRASVSAGPQCTASPELRRALQHLTLRAAGPVRTAAGLADALTALRELRGSAAGDPAQDPGEQLEALATRNLLDVAELVLVSARRREETRGSHFREDRPTRDDRRWLVNQVIDRAGESPRLVEAPVELVHFAPERPEKGTKE
jgi:succinate dehydrogenase/fumarate reductase flavoprotein subunit